MADFPARHIGPDETDEAAMLRTLGVGTLDELAAETVPADIRFAGTLDLPAPVDEAAVLGELRALAAKNQIWKSFIGMGYSDCVTPPVIQRNILENPGWYTAYTPYQAEISQGRLEALINYQTMVADLTGLPIANASLLDEGTAAAEAMHMLHALAPALENDDDANAGAGAGTFLVSDTCHPQTIDVVRTRAKPLGIEVRVGDAASFDFAREQRVFGVLVQYPATDGALPDWRDLCKRAHDAGALVAMATDLLALTVLTPPGELGADVAVGSAQRFGVPLGYGGPHAAFFATRGEWVRKLPGRLIGVTEDRHGHVAYRMALQTREQHIRREKATSNICTAQVLLAVIAGMYAVYHGPKGLRAIAERVSRLAGTLAAGLDKLGKRVKHRRFFDTVRVDGNVTDVAAWLKAARGQADQPAPAVGDRGDDLGRRNDDRRRYQSVVEGLRRGRLLRGFAADEAASAAGEHGRRWQGLRPALGGERADGRLPDAPGVQHAPLRDGDAALHAAGWRRKDLSLTHSMIPLGSCTMKLNATAEMMPVTWPEFGELHPFAPAEQTAGYREIFTQPREDGWRRSPASRRCRCSRTPARRANTRACSSIRAYHESRGAGAPRRLPDPVVRARHQPGVGGHGGLSASSSSPATTTATSISPTWKRRRRSTRTRSRR